MHHKTFLHLAFVVVLTSGISAGLTQAASAQSAKDNLANPQKSAAGTEKVELPPLLVDLFRSTSPEDLKATPPPSPSPLALSRSPNALASPLTDFVAALPPVSTSGAFVPDEVLVTVNGDAQAVQDIAAALGLDVRSVRTSFLLETSVVRFGIPDGRSVALVLAQLKQDGRASRSEPNHIYTLQQADTVSSYALENINFSQNNPDGSNIRIAVIDTARDRTHPALANIVADDFDALPDTPVVNADHGTSIIGLIAGQDVFQGVAPGAHIYHARAFENGRSNANAILAALDWSAEQNVQIVNMSFVGPRNNLFEQACNAAYERGILLVAAAGNNGPKAPVAYPGAYKSVVAVTATDDQNHRMAQANIGSYIAISAPGVGVMAPIPGGGFDSVTGTSFAAAIYTGAVANLMKRDPAQSALEIERIATKTALDLGIKGKDVEFGYGLINFRSAIQAFNR